MLDNEREGSWAVAARQQLHSHEGRWPSTKLHRLGWTRSFNADVGRASVDVLEAERTGIVDRNIGDGQRGN